MSVVRRSPVWLLLAVAVMTAAAACSVSVELGSGPESRAVELIEGDLAAQVGLGDLDGSCTEPASSDAGTTFLCTGTTSDGRMIQFEAGIRSDDTVNVDSTNIIVADAVPLLEEAAVAALENAIGATLGTENFDCGEETIIIDLSTRQFTCILTDPFDGARYEATVTLAANFETLENVEVAETPLP